MNSIPGKHRNGAASAKGSPSWTMKKGTEESCTPDAPDAEAILQRKPRRRPGLVPARGVAGSIGET